MVRVQESDKPLIEQRFLKGTRIAEVAREFHVSRITAQAYRNKLVMEGKISPIRARTKLAHAAPKNGAHALTLEQVQEVIIQAFEKAKECESLKEKLNRAENILAATKNQNVILTEEVQKLKERELRFRLAQQQGV